MNLRVLHTDVVNQLDVVRPLISGVFDHTMSRVTHWQRGVNVSSFVRRLNEALRGTNIKVSTETQDTIDPSGPGRTTGYPAVGGYCYEPHSQHKLARIRLIVCTHSTTNRFEMPQDGWNFFHYRFLKTTAHELVHRAQYTHGRKRTNALVFRPHTTAQADRFLFKEQTYMGDIDEVEAYARDCVEEWTYRLPDLPMTPRRVEREFAGDRRIPALSYYHTAYSGDATHPSVRRFFRKVREWQSLLVPLSSSLPPCPTFVNNIWWECL